jgi:hypothetical protein
VPKEAQSWSTQQKSLHLPAALSHTCEAHLLSCVQVEPNVPLPLLAAQAETLSVPFVLRTRQELPAVGAQLVAPQQVVVQVPLMTMQLSGPQRQALLLQSEGTEHDPPGGPPAGDSARQKKAWWTLAGVV